MSEMTPPSSPRRRILDELARDAEDLHIYTDPCECGRPDCPNPGPPSSPRAGRSTVSAAGEHPWDQPHNDSCDCHIGICMDCGCTSEYAAETRPSVPERLERIIRQLPAWSPHPDVRERVEGEPLLRQKDVIDVIRRHCAASPAGPEAVPPDPRCPACDRAYRREAHEEGCRWLPSGAVPQSEREGLLREALEHVIDVWSAPSPEEFARLHRVLTGHDSCSPAHPDEEPR